MSTTKTQAAEELARASLDIRVDRQDLMRIALSYYAAKHRESAPEPKLTDWACFRVPVPRMHLPGTAIRLDAETP